MSSNALSIRFPAHVATRLRLEAAARGETVTAIVQRLADQGLRMIDHPDIVFQDGPTGWRATLLHGPDVWEVIWMMRRIGIEGEIDGADDLVRRTVEELQYSERMVRAALAYYLDYRDEIDARVERNRTAGERYYAQWLAEQEEAQSRPRLT